MVNPAILVFYYQLQKHNLFNMESCVIFDTFILINEIRELKGEGN